MVASDSSPGLPSSPDISPEWVIIHDIFHSESSSNHEIHELEFDRALEFTPKIIVIEPPSLADATRRWISIGNGLSKAAVFCSLASVTTFSITKNTSKSLYFMFPLTGVSLVCCALYNVSWSGDPCIHYQEDRSAKTRSQLPLGDNMTEAVILVRSMDTKRRALHTTVTLVALSFVVLRVIQWFRDL